MTQVNYDNPFENAGAVKPSCKYVEWSGDKGEFSYYDKERAARVSLGSRIAVVPLMEYKTVKGYDESESTGIYANEVIDTRSQVLNVRNFAKTAIASGLWAEISDKVIRAGGKFAVSVYAWAPALKEVINLTLHGSSIGCWFDSRPVAGSMVILARKAEQDKKGTNLYWSPFAKIEAGTTQEAKDKITAAKADAMEAWPVWAAYLRERDTANAPAPIEQGNAVAAPALTNAPASMGSPEDFSFGADATALANMNEQGDDLPF